MAIKWQHLAQTFTQQGVDLCFRFMPQKDPGEKLKKLCRVVAHRGAHDNQQFIENTLPAFHQAKNLKAWGIEFDVRFTRDAVPIVHHDTCTSRLFGKTVEVAKTDWVDLKAQFPLIPRLADVIEQMRGHMHMMIEVKDPLASEDLRCKNLKSLLTSMQAREDFHLLGLTPPHLLPFTHLDPKTLILVPITNMGLLTKEIFARAWGGLAGHYVLLNARIREKLREKDMKVGVGFLASRNSLWRELNLGCDWVFTNHPREMLNFLSTTTTSQ